MTDQTPFGLACTPANKETVECLEAVKEIAASNPRVGQEMLRILAEDKNQSLAALASPTAPPPAIGATSAAPESGRQSRPRRKYVRSKSAPRRRLTRLELHEAHCCICGANDQQEIEEAFVNWECVSQIAREYNIERRSIYRHAHAVGLFDRRDRNIRGALGHIIQSAGRVETTADSVIRAVKTFAHLNPRGEWFNPPTHVIVSPRAPQISRANLPRAPKRSATSSKVIKRLKP